MDNTKKPRLLADLFLMALIYFVGLASGRAGENVGPDVSILWPTQGLVFSSEIIKFKSAVADADGSVTQVQFFAGTNLLGTVTNPPFNVLAQLPEPDPDPGSWSLKAVATDNAGAITESAPVVVYVVGTHPLASYLQLASPPPGALFAAPATFSFSAELLAGTGPGQIEFLLGTNSLAVVNSSFSATAPPDSIMLTNLPEGSYPLNLKFFGPACTCFRVTNTVHVVTLRIQKPTLSVGGQFQFQTQTSFPGPTNVIQVSSDLLNWLPIATNYPYSTNLDFTDPTFATNAQRFYRVFIPPP